MAAPSRFNIGFNQIRAPLTATALASAVLGLAVSKTQKTASAEPVLGQSSAHETTVTLPQAKLTDLLAGRHLPVRVYYKHPNSRGDYGEYPDGEHLDANCKTTGQYQRFRGHHSKLWFGVNDEKAFVNSIHVSNADRLQNLEQC